MKPHIKKTIEDLEQQKKQIEPQLQRLQKQMSDLTAAISALESLAQSEPVQVQLVQVAPMATAAPTPTGATRQRPPKIGRVIRLAADAGLPDVFTIDALALALNITKAKANSYAKSWLSPGFVEQVAEGWKKTALFPAKSAETASA